MCVCTDQVLWNYFSRPMWGSSITYLLSFSLIELQFPSSITFFTPAILFSPGSSRQEQVPDAKILCFCEEALLQIDYLYHFIFLFFFLPSSTINKVYSMKRPILASRTTFWKTLLHHMFSPDQRDSSEADICRWGVHTTTQHKHAATVHWSQY